MLFQVRKSFLTVIVCNTILIFAGDYNQTKKTEGSNIIEYKGSLNYELVERTDLRRYDNGRYTGLLSREVHSFITRQTDENGAFLYEGDFYLDETTRRQNAVVGSDICESIPAKFKITENGELVMLEDNGYPSFRGFPAYTNKELQPGDVWKAEAVRAVDPLNKGIVTKMPVYVEYIFKGDQIYNGFDCFVINANWATRYGARYYIDFDGDQDLIEANGSHNAVIMVRKDSGEAIVVRDNVNEIFTYKTQGKINFKGTICLFTKYPPSVNTQELFEEFEKQEKIVIQTKDINTNDEDKGTRQEKINFKVQKTNSGLRLTLPNLQFKADKAELLEGETQRLDTIAQLLKKTGNTKLLVEGHTADTGNPQEEKQLSLERACTIARELSDRGIPIERFICKGNGALKPVSDNETQEGKAANRRVEITILSGSQ